MVIRNKKFLILCGFLSACTSGAQVLPTLLPRLGTLIEKSEEGEHNFLIEQQKCLELWERSSTPEGKDSLSAEELKDLENCTEDYDSYWDVLGNGCSWYCGGGLDTLTATSYLQAQGNWDYKPANLHDLSYKTAWIEGVPGYGIGEKITYHFPPENPRITEIIIVNGYAKSDRAWHENSRVKTLKMYLNGEPYRLLRLTNSKNEQHFTFSPLGYANRTNWEELIEQPWWSLTFEILEVYPGDKYDDTALTELYFDGIDVH